jgi:hypothetical protein
LVWVNDPWEIDPSNRYAFGRGKGFGYFEGRPPPRFRVGYKEARRLHDTTYCSGPSWMICSRRLAGLFQEFQPDGIATQPIEVELKTGEILSAGEYVMLDATLLIPALDGPAMGRAIVQYPTFRVYQPNLDTSMILRKDVPPHAKIFRDDVATQRIFVSNDVREECKRRGYSRYLYFRDPAKP